MINEKIKGDGEFRGVGSPYRINKCSFVECSFWYTVRGGWQANVVRSVTVQSNAVISACALAVNVTRIQHHLVVASEI